MEDYLNVFRPPVLRLYRPRVIDRSPLQIPSLKMLPENCFYLSFCLTENKTRHPLYLFGDRYNIGSKAPFSACLPCQVLPARPEVMPSEPVPRAKRRFEKRNVVVWGGWVKRMVSWRWLCFRNSIVFLFFVCCMRLGLMLLDLAFRCVSGLPLLQELNS